MSCPDCQPFYDDPLEPCATCGQIDSRAALERLSHLAFLIAWLDEHQADLAAPSYRGLRQAAQQQLAQAQPAARVPDKALWRPVDAVLRERACLTAILQALAGWVAAGGLRPAAAARLRHHLAGHREDLILEQAGRAGAPPPVSQAEGVDYALGALDQWGRAGALAAEDHVVLAAYLAGRHAALRALLRASLRAPAGAAPRPAAPQPAS